MLGEVHNKYTHHTQKNISVIRIEKFPFSWLRKIKARLTLLQQATVNPKKERQNREQRTKKKPKKIKKINKTLKTYEQQCQSHTCSGTIVAKTIKAIAYSLCSIRPGSSHAIDFLK